MHPPPLIRLNTGIFEPNQSSVGLLPAEEAYVVALAYKLVQNLDEEFRRLMTSWPINGVTKNWISSRANSVERILELAVNGLAETAGLAADKREAIGKAIAEHKTDQPLMP